MAAYNRWANAHLYALCAALTDEARKRDLGAFFKSIHGTLNHLLLGDRLWLSRLQGTALKVDSLGAELYDDFVELRAARLDTDRALEDWTSTLTPAELAGELRYLGMAPPVPRCYPVWFALMHLFNHQTHHRGQITTLLVQLGVDAGSLDLIGLPTFNP
jgi:uncharacterized damage-inducible protein DinB